MRIEVQVESLRRIFPVRRINNLLAALLAAVVITSTGCGVSDSVKSIMLTATGSSSGGFYNLVGVDGTLQLKAYAIYHSGKQVDVTNDSTWTVTPEGADQWGQPLPPYGPTTVPIDKTGMMTAIVPICTWTDLQDSSKLPAVAYFNPPQWAYTGWYQTTATYKGMTSQPVAVGVGAETSNTSPIGGCGPS